jgi:hypothetical protein
MVVRAGVVGVEMARLYPVGTLVAAVNVCVPEAKAPLAVGVTLKFTVAAEVFNVIVEADTSPSPVIALEPCGCKKKLPTRSENAKLASNTPSPITGVFTSFSFSLDR